MKDLFRKISNLFNSGKENRLIHEEGPEGPDADALAKADVVKKALQPMDEVLKKYGDEENPGEKMADDVKERGDEMVKKEKHPELVKAEKFRVMLIKKAGAEAAFAHEMAYDPKMSVGIKKFLEAEENADLASNLNDPETWVRIHNALIEYSGYSARFEEEFGARYVVPTTEHVDPDFLDILDEAEDKKIKAEVAFEQNEHEIKRLEDLIKGKEELGEDVSTLKDQLNEASGKKDKLKADLDEAIYVYEDLQGKKESVDAANEMARKAKPKVKSAKRKPTAVKTVTPLKAEEAEGEPGEKVPKIKIWPETDEVAVDGEKAKPGEEVEAGEEKAAMAKAKVAPEAEAADLEPELEAEETAEDDPFKKLFEEIRQSKPQEIPRLAKTREEIIKSLTGATQKGRFSVPKGTLTQEVNKKIAVRCIRGVTTEINEAAYGKGKSSIKFKDIYALLKVKGVIMEESLSVRSRNLSDGEKVQAIFKWTISEQEAAKIADYLIENQVKSTREEETDELLAAAKLGKKPEVVEEVKERKEEVALSPEKLEEIDQLVRLGGRGALVKFIGEAKSRGEVKALLQRLDLTHKSLSDLADQPYREGGLNFEVELRNGNKIKLSTNHWMVKSAKELFDGDEINVDWPGGSAAKKPTVEPVESESVAKKKVEKKEPLATPKEYSKEVESQIAKLDESTNTSQIIELFDSNRLSDHEEFSGTEAQYKVAQALRQEGRFDESVELYQDYIKSHPESTDAYWGLARALEKSDKPSEAVSAYENYIRLEKDTTKASSVETAKEKIASLQTEVSTEAIAESIQTEKLDIDELNDYLANFIDEDDYSRVVAKYEEDEMDAREDFSGSLAQYNIAYSLRKLGRYEEAADLYKDFLSKESKDADAYYALGETLEALGDEKGAVDAFQKYLENEERTDRARWKDKIKEKIAKYNEANDKAVAVKPAAPERGEKVAKKPVSTEPLDSEDQARPKDKVEETLVTQEEVDSYLPKMPSSGKGEVEGIKRISLARSTAGNRARASLINELGWTLGARNVKEKNFIAGQLKMIGVDSIEESPAGSGKWIAEIKLGKKDKQRLIRSFLEARQKGFPASEEVASRPPTPPPKEVTDMEDEFDF